ncbi:MAG: helix-hairpin-helix domain-containing protein [Chitinophagaceae bacterium]|nr:helix-hairpin-helix domain-containing protein [Chitinophagaceae bacterium]
MDVKKFFEDYFSFTKKERIAVLVMTSIIIMLTILPEFIAKNNNPLLITEKDTSWLSFKKPVYQNHSRYQQDDEFSGSVQYEPSSSNYFFEEKPGELFIFDPNTLSREGWRKLGISEKTIRTIQNYLNKGGRFRKPEDLKKIYGFRIQDFERLSPYIQIVAMQKSTEASAANLSPQNTARPVRSIRIIDINTADSADFILLPGIGEKLSARIVAFRNKLGGFYSIQQIAETYGLHDSVFQKIKPYLSVSPSAVKKININKATLEELKAHPYIRYYNAKAIIAYREQHGFFEKTEDLKKIMIISEESYQKMAPYLTTQ